MVPPASCAQLARQKLLAVVTSAIYFEDKFCHNSRITQYIYKKYIKQSLNRLQYPPQEWLQYIWQLSLEGMTIATSIRYNRQQREWQMPLEEKRIVGWRMLQKSNFPWHSASALSNQPWKISLPFFSSGDFCSFLGLFFLSPPLFLSLSLSTSRENLFSVCVLRFKFFSTFFVWPYLPSAI